MPSIETKRVEIVGECALVGVYTSRNGDVWVLCVFFEDHLGRTIADHFTTDSRGSRTVSGG
jgi:hypothetical protein